MDASSTPGKKNSEEKRIREQHQQRREKLLNVIQLTRSAKDLYKAIAEDYPSGRCWKTNETLASEAHILPNHIPRYLNELQDVRLIRIGITEKHKREIYLWLELLKDLWGSYALTFQKKNFRPYPLRFFPELLSIPEPSEAVRHIEIINGNSEKVQQLPFLERKFQLAVQEFSNPNSQFTKRFCEANSFRKENITNEFLVRQLKEMEALEKLLEFYFQQTFNWAGGTFPTYTRIPNPPKYPPDVRPGRNKNSNAILEFFAEYFQQNILQEELPEFTFSIVSQLWEKIMKQGRPLQLPFPLLPQLELGGKPETSQTLPAPIATETSQTSTTPEASENTEQELEIPPTASEQNAVSEGEASPSSEPPAAVAQTLNSILSNKHKSGSTSVGELLGTLTTLPPLPKEKQVIREKLVNEFNIPFEQADDLCRKHNFEELKNLIQEFEKYANQH